MSIINPSLFNASLGTSPQQVCFDTRAINSRGVFLGDDPLRFSVPLFLLDLSLMFFTATTTHCILRRLGQSRFVSDLLAGILLGPSVIGQNQAFQQTVFPERAIFLVDSLSLISLIFFVFIIGVKTDLSLLQRPGKRAVAIGVAGSVLPFALSVCTFFALRRAFPDDLGEGSLIFFVASRLSLSSFPVIAYTLDELRLLNSDLGRVVLSASLFSDVINWGVASLTSAYTMITAVKTPGTAIGIVASLAGSLLFVLLVARPTLMWSVRRTPAGETLVEWHFLVLLMTALLMSLATQAFGYNVTLGPLMLGLAIPGGMPVGQTIKEKLEPLGGELFLPMYIVLAGYRTRFEEVRNMKAWGVLEMVVVICYVGKLVGSVAMSRYFDMSANDAISVGLMLNIKGIVEISAFNTYTWGDSQIASTEHFSVLTVSMMVITAVTTPLIKLLYKPTMRYVARKRRTVEHARPRSLLRFMACVHNEEHVAPLLDLLEASYACRDSPIALTVLHLTELAGQSAAVLRPHKHSRRSANPTASDRIVNAFTYFEKQQAQPGSISVHPFVAMAPYSTLYNDVCSLALDRKVCFILLPFHKCCDGAQETVNHAFQTLNRNVLAFAPCSVAILVDRSLPAATCAHTNHLLHLVAVYFLGGPDDREALAFASRMANNRSITVTVIRLLPHVANDDKERKLDDAAVERLRESHAHNQRLVYMEKVVEDGEGTAAVIQEMSDQFDLLIVGRRKGVDSAPTRGLSEWSECPELGIIGDMLAAAEFTEKASILVVQQQTRFGGKLGGGGVETATATATATEGGNVVDPKKPEGIRSGVMWHR
ncbi:Sodium/hydrogen exchanger family [Musa troglodytarum]|uniref:Sodium/hydrogen exchanger family n=1 Tax=Musa troglodytarum TaxID=320322 RepID=A0A9E7FKQ6_9LILI|nr:Sodium/hydrogen exchanger family [Musa troglodytarum]